MAELRLTEDLRPLSDLKSKAAEIVRQVESTGRPVVITRHGRGVAVVLSLERYERYQALAERQALLRDITEAEADISAGRTVPHEEVVSRWEDRLGVKPTDED